MHKYEAPDGGWRVALVFFILAALMILVMWNIKIAQAANADGFEFSSLGEPELVLWETRVNKVIPFNGNKTFEAVMTKYSRPDSCHYPKIVNGKRLCLTAIGRDTKEGVTVACSRDIKLGTQIRITSKSKGTFVRTCEDRYNENLDSKRGLPTVDIFVEAENLKNWPSYEIVTVEVLK